jgi:hypothetical protein
MTRGTFSCMWSVRRHVAPHSCRRVKISSPYQSWTSRARWHDGMVVASESVSSQPSTSLNNTTLPWTALREVMLLYHVRPSLSQGDNIKPKATAQGPKGPLSKRSMAVGRLILGTRQSGHDEFESIVYEAEHCVAGGHRLHQGSYDRWSLEARLRIHIFKGSTSFVVIARLPRCTV